MVAPQLPYSADLGTMTGWILDETVASTPAGITQELEQSFNRLVDNIPDTAHTDYGNFMRKMTDEIINSNTLIVTVRI